jgi:hypothetical protein
LVYEHCITYTSKKKGCHPPFITTSWWHMHGRGKRSQTWNHHAQ